MLFWIIVSENPLRSATRTNPRNRHRDEIRRQKYSSRTIHHARLSARRVECCLRHIPISEPHAPCRRGGYEGDDSMSIGSIPRLQLNGIISSNPGPLMSALSMRYMPNALDKPEIPLPIMVTLRLKLLQKLQRDKCESASTMRRYVATTQANDSLVPESLLYFLIYLAPGHQLSEMSFWSIESEVRGKIPGELARCRVSPPSSYWK
ncbi:hypothetical protein BDW75DRAFT_7248 [Aspergillus navahoensis]